MNQVNTASSHRPLRVLLAEDNKVNQQFATLILSKAGHSVEVAANGRLAVDAVERADFDVVLMDIQMPELDGVEATQEIRALPQPKGHVPIIAVTAHAMAGAREKYLAAGMDEYISKPFQPALLLAVIAQFSDRVPPFFSSAATGASEARTDTPRLEELPVLDLKQLGTLGTVFSLPKIRTLASLYMLDVEARLVLIDGCRALNDFDGISRQAHMLVSTAGNLGAKQSSALASRLEISCGDRDAALSDRLVGELRASCALSSDAIRRWLHAAASADIAAGS